MLCFQLSISHAVQKILWQRIICYDALCTCECMNKFVLCGNWDIKASLLVIMMSASSFTDIITFYVHANIACIFCGNSEDEGASVWMGYSSLLTEKYLSMLINSRKFLPSDLFLLHSSIPSLPNYDGNKMQQTSFKSSISYPFHRCLIDWTQCGADDCDESRKLIQALSDMWISSAVQIITDFNFMVEHSR